MTHSRGLKIYLAVVTVLLIAALGVGVYVWYTLLTLQTVETRESAVTPGSEKTTDASPPTQTTTTASPKVIDVSSLSESQQSMLKSFGIESDSITLTSGMIRCAEEAVGAERLNAITQGAAPSPLEAIKLLPCFKK